MISRLREEIRLLVFNYSITRLPDCSILGHDFMGYLLKDFQDAWESYFANSLAHAQSERVSSNENAAQTLNWGGAENSSTNASTRISAIDADSGGVEAFGSIFRAFSDAPETGDVSRV